MLQSLFEFTTEAEKIWKNGGLNARERGMKKRGRRGGKRKRERERECLKQGEGGLSLADVIRRLYQALAGEESAVKREVCHWFFVLAKQEENTFVKAAAWWGDK